MKRNSKFILSFIIALIAVTAFTGCNDNSAKGGDGTTSTVERTQSAATDIGEGETVFLFEVTDDKGEIYAWNVSTTEKTVGAALLAVGLIAGDESSNGLYIKSVNGITADYNTDKSYWAFYIDGDYAASGVDSTDIETDKTYALVYTKD